MEKKLGKITRFVLGKGGYQQAMFGVSISLSFNDSTGTGDFKGGWVERSPDAGYSEATLEANHAGVYRWLRSIMRDAKATHFHDMVGKPVEAEFDGFHMKSWRILTEVL